MNYNIPEVSKEELNLFRKLSPEIIKTVIERSMEIKEDISQHGDKALDILTYGINLTTKMLDNSMNIHEPAILDEQLKWAMDRLPIDGVKPEHIYNRIRIYIDVVNELLPAVYAKEINNFLEWMSVRQKDLMERGILMFDEEYFDNLYNKYLNFLLNKDRKSAELLILGAVKDNVNIKDIYLKIFQRSQYQVGELWQKGKISVAHEHFCTAITESVMSLLYQNIFQSEKIGKNFLAFCITEELHDLGLKMITDLVEMIGFNTVYLGANVPTKHIEEAISDYQADVIGISITMANRINDLVDLIEKIRLFKFAQKIKIIIGGYCLNNSENLWKKIGADAFAKDGEEATKIILELVSKE